MTDELAGLAIERTRATYRPAGRMTFNRAVEVVRGAIDAAAAPGVQEMLVDTRELTGFASPDTFERRGPRARLARREATPDAMIRSARFVLSASAPPTDGASSSRARSERSER